MRNFRPESITQQAEKPFVIAANLPSETKISKEKPLTVSGACGIKDERYQKLEEYLDIIISAGQKSEVIKLISTRKDFTALEKCLLSFLAGSAINRPLTNPSEIIDKKVNRMWTFLFATMIIFLLINLAGLFIRF